MGAIEFLVWAVQQTMTLPPIFMVVFFVLFVYVILRLFHLMAKSAIVGVVAAMFPVFLFYSGYPIELNTGTLLFFGAVGFVGHVVFASVMSVFRTGKTVINVGRKLAGGPKPRVIVKKIVVKEKKR